MVGVVEESGFLLSVWCVVEVLHISTELGGRLGVPIWLNYMYVRVFQRGLVRVFQRSVVGGGEGVSATGKFMNLLGSEGVSAG